MVKYQQAFNDVRQRILWHKQKLDSDCLVNFDPDRNASAVVYEGDWTFDEFRRKACITIGLKPLLTSHMKHPFSNSVSDKAFVYTIFSIDHEFYHMQDHLQEFSKADASDLKKISARSMILAGADPVYNQNVYDYMLSEYEANMVGAVATVDYFQKQHPDIPADKILAEILSSVPAYFPYGKTDDFDEVITYMAGHKEEYAHHVRKIDLEHGSDLTQDFIHDKKFLKEYSESLSDGAEADKTAVRWLLKSHPERAGMYPCIQDEIPEPEKCVIKHREVPESFEDLYQKDQQQADSEKGLGE